MFHVEQRAQGSGADALSEVMFHVELLESAERYRWTNGNIEAINGINGFKEIFTTNGVRTNFNEGLSLDIGRTLMHIQHTDPLFV